MNVKLLSLHFKSFDKNEGNQPLNRLYSNLLELALVFCVLFISSLSFAQTGPAGVDSGIKLWLDASDLDGDGIIEDMAETGVNPADSSITQWRDKSISGGTGPLFTVPATYTSPKYRPYDAAFGGLTTVDFVPTNALSHVLSTGWTGTSHTIFIVFKQKGSSPIATGKSIFSSGRGIPNDPSIDNYFRIGSDSAATTADFTYHTTTGTGTAQVITETDFGSQTTAQAGVVFYSATRSGTAIVTYENGTQTLSETLGAGGNEFDEYLLNLNRDGTISNDCYIAEIIIYDIVLTGQPRRRVHDYLTCKYLNAFAGPVPGGIDPCDVSLWLKADVSTTTITSGVDIDTWSDQSNYGFDGIGVSTGGGDKPQHVPSDNNFNASISFDDGNNERLYLGASPAVGTYDPLTMGIGNFSIYSVAKAVIGEDGTLFSDNLCEQSSGYRLRYNSGSNGWFFNGIPVAQTSSVVGPLVAVETANTTSPYSLISFKRAGTQHTLRTHQGGVSTVTVAPTLPLSATNVVTERWVGRRKNDGGTCSNDHFDGNISELIIVRSTVSAVEDKKIQTYLGIKYGLTIPSSLGNYLASDGLTSLWTFTSSWNNVAGIGQDDGSALHQRVGKSQNPTGLITMATNADFTSANNASRAPMGDGNFLLWGKNSTPATSSWSNGGAPNNFAILPAIWRVKKTGTVPTIHLQVDVDDPESDMPDFVGDLYLVHGPNLSMAVPVLMTEAVPGSGLWSVSGVNFSDSAFFTFAVRNDLSIEFSTAASTSVDEQTMGTFPNVLGTGTVNVASSFNVNVVGGSATNNAVGPDYAYTNQMYTVDTGSYTLNTFPLIAPTLAPINQDLIDEGLETAIFQIILGTGIDYGDVDGTGGAIQIHTMTISDDDSYQIAIGSPVNGVEDTSPATFVISMAGGATMNTSGAPITGTLTYAGDAQAGVDYTAQPTFTIAMNAPSTTVTLPMIDDSDLEGSETIIATIATSVGAVPQTPTATTNIIDDEESSVQVSIGSPVSVNEGSGSVSFTVSLGTTNETGSPITGSLSYAPASTATNGPDFNGTVPFSIAPGASIGTVTSVTNPDNLVEPTESVIAVLTSTSVGTIHPTFYTDTAYIFDEDTSGLEISITSPVTTVVEGVGVTINYTIQLDGSKINGTGSDITGTVTLTGSAFPGGSAFPDYSNASTFGFAIPNGSGSTTVTLNITNDTIIEPPKTIIATISGLSIGTPDLTNNGISISLLDDDAGTIFISIGSPTDTTESPSGSPFVSFSVFIEGGILNTTGFPITGNITYSGTATPGSDFTEVLTYSIGLGANSTDIILPVIDNGATEPDETVIAILSGSPSEGSYANTNSTATIFDDDASSLLVSIGSPIDGEEGTADVSFVVSLDFGDINGTGSPIIGTITYSGAANAGDFLTTPSSNFSIPNGQSQTIVTLTVNDDDAVEYTESVIAVISSPSVGSIGTPSATANIVDNDEGALIISLDSPVNGTEGVDDVTFSISMQGGLTNGLGVPLTGNLVFSGTANPSFDFVNATQFSIPDGSGSVIHTLTVLNDLNIENMESVIATITSTLVGAPSGTVTDTAYIFDNDSILAELNIEAILDGLELPSPGTIDAQFEVSLAGGLINELGTDITGVITLSGTAIDGSDYTGVASFSIPNTSGTALITLPVIDDQLEEPTETIVATISSPNIGVIGAMGSATVNILDGDTDIDNDGLSDLYDPIVGNIDSDCDGIFDGCDADADGDGFLDAGLIDTDGDGIHDGCDASMVVDGVIDNGPDINDDDLNDVSWDPTDSDDDLLPNHVDPNDNNPDSDGDGIPDGADADVNGDGILDNGCDDDGDGIHNVADSDDSPSDGITDVGNADDNQNGIDNAWDPFSIVGGEQVNYIVSPNGDGTNETLRIKGIQFFENHKLIIFDRWGSPAFLSTEYDNDWAGEINQGIMLTDTEILPDGVYYYTIDLGNGEKTVKGFIELRR